MEGKVVFPKYEENPFSITISVNRDLMKEFLKENIDAFIDFVLDSRPSVANEYSYEYENELSEFIQCGGVV